MNEYLTMVISKPTAVVHPKSTIKETMVVNNNGSSTLPKVRSITRRVAELPSLRYGPMGAGCPVSGPLKVRESVPMKKYCRNYTTGMLVDDVPAIRSMQQQRRVRFALPPPDGSDLDEFENCVRYVATTTSSTSNPIKPTRIITTPSSTSSSSSSLCTTSYRSRAPAFNKSSQQQPVTSVTVITTTTSVKQRVHPVGKYIRGTLSPTTNSAAPLTPGAPISTALLRAARDADEQAVRGMLRNGLHAGGIPERELNAVDSSGRTALSYIVSNGSIDLVETIVQFPLLDINLPDNEGNTPLHFAAQAGQIECLNFLLSRCEGLEIDARNHLGFTPLMKAALQGRNKCAKLLLFAGANPTLRDTGRGLRAEQWARYCGRYVCADVIEKFARHRLLERSTSCGRWGSDTEIGATRILLGKVVPVPTQQQITQSQGIKSKLRKVFRTSSGPSESSSARLVTQLTSAALCASSPVLPAAPTVPPVVKSLIRPLTVPRLQITLANGAASLTATELNSLSAILDQQKQPEVQQQQPSGVEKPPRTKKKMK